MSKLSSESYPAQAARLLIGAGFLGISVATVGVVAPDLLNEMHGRFSTLNVAQQVGAVMLYWGVSAMAVRGVVMLLEDNQLEVEYE